MPSVILTPAAAEQLGKLPKTMKARMVDLLVRLSRWPQASGAKPLAGKLAGHWRMRTGDYRLQFSVAGEQVTVEQIGHRDGFYEESDE